jgi:hypothetical protein
MNHSRTVSNFITSQVSFSKINAIVCPCFDGSACSTLANPNTKELACIGGTCSIIGCVAGYENCDGIAANGCEIDLMTDNENCGGCDMQVSAHQSCVNGVKQCSSGFGNCDGDDENGCETDIITKPGYLFSE